MTRLWWRGLEQARRNLQERSVSKQRAAAAALAHFGVERNDAGEQVRVGREPLVQWSEVPIRR